MPATPPDDSRRWCPSHRAPDARGHPGGPAQTLPTVLLAVVAAGVFALSTPRMPTCSIDHSYQVGLDYAFTHHFVFGRDVVFSFGPLGFLHEPMFDPATYSWNVVFGLLLAFVFAIDLTTLAASSGRSVWLVTAIVPGLLLLCTQDSDSRFYLVGAVVLLLGTCATPPRTLWLLNTVLLAVLSLVKLNLLLLSSVLVTFVAAHAATCSRVERAFSIAGLYAASVIGTWLWVGQPLSALGAFLANGLAMMRAYGEAMVENGPRAEVWGFLVAAALLLVALLADVQRARRPRRALLLPAGTAALLFLLFKHGLTRQRYHGITASAGIAAVTGLYAVVFSGPPRSATTRLLLLASCVTAVASLSTSRWGAVYRPLWGRGALATEAGIVFGRLRGMTDGWKEDRVRWAEARERIREAHPLPALAGTVDVLSSGQCYVLAHDVVWRPRPVFQSYAAGSPGLQALNARRLRDAGPETMVADLATIDRRFPTLDQGPSLIELLRRYDVQQQPGEFLVLGRRREPRPVTLVPIATREAALGDAVPVPPSDSGLVWATIDLTPSLLGRLRGAVFRMPKLGLDVTLADGDAERFRLIPGMARAGFLLSPLVQFPNSLGALFTPTWQSLLSPFGVRSVTVCGWHGSAEHFYMPRFTIRFWRLRFTPPPDTRDEPEGIATDLDLRSVRAGHHVVLHAGPGDLRIDVTGASPWVLLPLVAPATARARRLVIELDLPHADVVRLYFRRVNDTFGEDRSTYFQLPSGRGHIAVTVPRYPVAVAARLDPGTRPGSYHLISARLVESD